MPTQDETSASVNSRTAGFEPLGFAVIEQAVEDVKHLKQYGIIKRDGTVTRKWPTFIYRGRRMRQKYLNYYDRPIRVIRLIYYFKSMALTNLLKLLFSTIKPRDMRDALKI